MNGVKWNGILANCYECRERNGLHSHVINGVKRNVTIACDEWTEMECFFLAYYE